MWVMSRHAQSYIFYIVHACLTVVSFKVTHLTITCNSDPISCSLHLLQMLCTTLFLTLNHNNECSLAIEAIDLTIYAYLYKT